MIGFHRALLRRTVRASSAPSASSRSGLRVDGPPRVSTALRRAALDVMRDPRYAHPFYWASFRVVGAPIESADAGCVPAPRRAPQVLAEISYSAFLPPSITGFFFDVAIART